MDKFRNNSLMSHCYIQETFYFPEGESASLLCLLPTDSFLVKYLWKSQELVLASTQWQKHWSVQIFFYMWTHTCSSSGSSSQAAFSVFLLRIKNKYLPLVSFGAEMWRMRKCWCFVERAAGDGLQALKHVGWPRSLCTLPVFLCSFTFDLKTET